MEQLESITEMPATDDDLAKLRTLIRHTVRFLDHTYKVVLDVPESDEADVAVGSLGLSLKNTRMALSLINNARKRDFHQYARQMREEDRVKQQDKPKKA
jgi:hypothetical protein